MRLGIAIPSVTTASGTEYQGRLISTLPTPFPSQGSRARSHFPVRASFFTQSSGDQRLLFIPQKNDHWVDSRGVIASMGN